MTMENNTQSELDILESKFCEIAAARDAYEKGEPQNGVVNRDTGYRFRSHLDLCKMLAEENGMTEDAKTLFEDSIILSQSFYLRLIDYIESDSREGALYRSEQLGRVASKGDVADNLRYRLDTAESFATAFELVPLNQRGNVARHYLESTLSTLRCLPTGEFGEWESRHRNSFLREMIGICYIGRLSKTETDDYIGHIKTQLDNAIGS